jgi:class 3 adenylate cyclase/streptogramin lyase
VARRGGSALVTVLFTDIAGSTDAAAEMGDRKWRELLTRHHRIVRRHLKEHNGHEVDTAGDGFLATFVQPAEAVRCARAIAEDVQALGIDIRAGVHVGEAERMGRGVGGVVVHTGARIAALARPAELLVSRTLRDLVPGARFGFEDRGAHSLKGVPGEHQLYRVTTVDGRPAPEPLNLKEAVERREEIEPPPLHRRRGVVVGLASAVVLTAIGVSVAVALREEPRRQRDSIAPSTLVRVDASTNRAVETIPGLPFAPSTRQLTYEPTLVAESGVVWVAAGQNLARVDPDTGEAETVSTSKPPIEMTVGHDSVWATTSGFDLLMRFDPATLEETDDLEIGMDSSFAIPLGVSLDSLWAASQDELARIDPVSGRVDERYSLAFAADEISVTAKDVWLIDRLAKTLARFDIDEGRIVEDLALQTAPDDLAAGEEGDVWLVNREAGAITPVQGGEPGEPIQVGSQPVDVAVSEDAVWVANKEDGSVTRIDPDFGRVEATIPIGGPVTAVAVDSSTGDVWAFVF